MTNFRERETTEGLLEFRDTLNGRKGRNGVFALVLNLVVLEILGVGSETVNLDGVCFKRTKEVPDRCRIKSQQDGGDDFGKGVYFPALVNDCSEWDLTTR